MGTFTHTEPPRIYVASLADYNSGKLVGRWIDAGQDAEDIRAEIQEMLDKDAEPGAEEYAIHDYDGFYGLKVGEYDDLETISTLAQALAEHGEAFAAYVANFGIEYAEVDDFEGAYVGQWDSLRDYAEEYATEQGLVDDDNPLHLYVDWDAYARDFEVGGDIWTADASEAGGGIHVFLNI